MARPRYQVALSYAGAQRAYVRQVADYLRQHQISFFYDEHERSYLWGKDGPEELDSVFRLNSQFVVIFISAEYRKSNWTRIERRSAFAAAMRTESEYLLPVRFDATELEGLPPTTFMLDANELSPEKIGESVVAKLRGSQKPERTVAKLDLFRLVSATNAREAWSGKGAARLGGRWTQKGTEVVYCASSMCTAILDVLAHVGRSDFLHNLISSRAEVQLSTRIEVVRASDLPARWKQRPAPAPLAFIGSKWAARGETCVLELPSVMLPNERMYLLNPAHRDFRTLSVVAEEPVGDLVRLLDSAV